MKYNFFEELNWLIFFSVKVQVRELLANCSRKVMLRNVPDLAFRKQFANRSRTAREQCCLECPYETPNPCFFRKTLT